MMMWKTEMRVYVKEYGYGTVNQVIQPYYFIKFDDGINRIVHEKDISILDE